MRIARFTTGNDPRYALVDGEPGPRGARRRDGRPAVHARAAHGGADPARPGRRAAARARHPALEDHRRRPQLRRARRRARQRAPARAAAVPQAQHLGDRPRRPDRAAVLDRARRPRGRAGRRHRQGHQGRPDRARARPRLRLHRRQRRHRPRHPAQRRPVDPRQGLRRLVPHRPVDRARPGRRRPRRDGARQRRDAPGRPHLADGVRRGLPRLLRLRGLHAAARRRDPHGHPSGRGPDRGPGRRGGRGRGDRRAAGTRCSAAPDPARRRRGKRACSGTRCCAAPARLHGRRACSGTRCSAAPERGVAPGASFSHRSPAVPSVRPSGARASTGGHRPSLRSRHVRIQPTRRAVAARPSVRSSSSPRGVARRACRSRTSPPSGEPPWWAARCAPRWRRPASPASWSPPTTPGIADEARRHGADVVERPAELSGATASSESAVLHALDALGGRLRRSPSCCSAPRRSSTRRTWAPRSPGCWPTRPTWSSPSPRPTTSSGRSPTAR